MTSVSKYLKKLSEEKLIAREEDGGAPSGDVGAVIGPDSGNSDSSDVLQGGEAPKNGLVTTDILGKCDHKKDGFFGPGCFHLPCIWTVPSFRYPRKKRKKLKYSNTVNEEDEFQIFQKYAYQVIDKEVDSAQEYLEKLDPGISIECQTDYQFEDEKADWIAALDNENQPNPKTFMIAFNVRGLYDFLYDAGLEMDEAELHAQIRVSLWHELGHALIQYFRDEEIYDFEVSGVEEEKLVEEFARYHIKKQSGVFQSKLQNFINEIFTNDDEKIENVEETKGDVLTDFKQPIKLSNPARFIGKEDYSQLSRKFVVQDVPIPGDVGLFAEQNGKDVLISFNKSGLMCIKVKVEPEDSDEQEFLELPEPDQKRFVDILRNIQQYLNDPKDDFELDVASEFESATDDDRIALANRYDSLIGGFRTLWYRPTLIDTIRICTIGQVGFLPLDMLVKIDEHDHKKEKRYIESDNQLNESVRHQFVKDMHYLQSTKGHFAQSRWFLLNSEFKTDLDLGFAYYTIKLYKENGVGTNYIFSSGVLFGYDESDRRLQTVYYIEPCEVVYMLSKGKVEDGDPQKVSVRLLSRCLNNLIEKKAFIGHRDRRQSY